MMSLQEEKIEAPIFFKEYVDGKIFVNVGEYDYPLIVSAVEVLNYQEEIKSIQDISKSHLELVLASDPEVIIIGTGQIQTLPSIEIINELAKVGKSAEFMASDVACKTYNLLVNENRNVSCIII